MININDLFDIPITEEKTWSITGTFHGSIIYCKTEGEARRTFHKHYNGESILCCHDRTQPNYINKIINL